MIWMFVAALLLGGGLIVMGLLGHHDGGHGDVGGHSDGHAGDGGLLALLSLRNLAWASFAFGGIGTLAMLTRRSLTTTVVSSIAAGVITLLIVHTIFRVLRSKDVTAESVDVLAVGASARLVLPFNDQDGLGVITFVANGQVYEMPARRAAEVATFDSTYFSTCRIDVITNGVAIVQPAA